MARMVRKQLYLTDEENRLLAARARGLGVTEAEVIRRAVDQALGCGERAGVEFRPDPEAVDYCPPPPIASAYDPTQDYRPAGEDTTRPLIPVPTGTDTAERKAKKKPVEWLWWAGVLVLALVTSIVLVFVLPLLKLFE